MTLRVLDTSSYQATLDLRNVSYDAVMVKATQGLTYVNPYCDQHIQEAIAQGKLNGVYHYANVANDPRAEARYFVANIKGYLDGTTMLALDNETNTNVAWAAAWHDEVYRLTGVYALHYGSESVYKGQIDWSPISKNHGLWVARYADMVEDFNWDMSMAGQMPDVQWNDAAPYVMWQWTSVGRLNGYGADLDESIFYGDAKTWLAYCKDQRVIPAPTPAPIVTPTPPPQPVVPPVAPPVIEPTPVVSPDPTPAPVIPPTPAPTVVTPTPIPPMPAKKSSIITAIATWIGLVIKALFDRKK